MAPGTGGLGGLQSRFNLQHCLLMTYSASMVMNACCTQPAVPHWHSTQGFTTFLIPVLQCCACLSVLPQAMNAWLAPSLPLTMSESELQGIKVRSAAV
jgi:hypothetical protein